MNLTNITDGTNKLQELGKKFGTDKRTNNDSDGYLNIMYQYMKDISNDNLNILEIGVREGPSILMWEAFFPNAKIYGLDIDDCTKHNNDRIKIIQGDQSDTKALESISSNVDYFDIIIDDGSHRNDDILISYNYLIKKLRPGGMYIIEDLSNSYPEGTCGNNKVKGCKREDLQALFNSIIYEMDKSSWGSQTDYLTIHFYPSLCIIKKRK